MNKKEEVANKTGNPKKAMTDIPKMEKKQT